MHNALSSRLRRAALMLPVGAVLALGACQENRASVFTPIGPRSLDFTMSPDGTNLPGGSVTLGAGTATVVAVGMRALTGSVYQFWGVSLDANNNSVYTKAFGSVLELFLRDSTDAGNVVTDPVTGEPIQVTDTTVVSAGGAATYAGTTDAAVFEVHFVLDSLDGGASTPDAENAVLLTIEGAEAATPGATRFLWRRVGVGGSGALTFGNFAGADPISATNPADYVYSPAGTGRGGFRGDSTASLELSVDFRGLARPPVGFFYRGYVVDTAGAATLVDTLRSAYSPVPELNRVNLFDADINPVLPGVVGGEIDAAQLRNCPSGAGVADCQNTMSLSGSPAFDGLAMLMLMLDPKSATAGADGGAALSATVPELVTQGQ